jgi:hypothetical protein
MPFLFIVVHALAVNKSFPQKYVTHYFPLKLSYYVKGNITIENVRKLHDR